MSACRKALNESPFVNGYLHKTIWQAERDCNHKEALPSCSKGTYYLGRTVRFIVSIPGAIIDFALQILQCIPVTVELLIIKLETRCRNIEFTKACTTVIYDWGLSKLIRTIRGYSTVRETFYLRQDLGLIKPGVIFTKSGGLKEGMGDTLSHTYYEWLKNKLFSMPPAKTQPTQTTKT